MIRPCPARPFTFTTSIGCRTCRGRRAARAGPTAIGGTARSCGRRNRTRAYREGRVSIQDEGSQLVALLAGRGETDPRSVCAAPGSKTALLARRNPRAKVFATELHPHRARLLQNLSSLAERPRSRGRRASFALLVRLRPHPCRRSLFRHRHSGPQPGDQVAAEEEDLRDLQSRQIAILKSALAQLAIGGRLVYSTCSLEREENETVVEAALDGTSEFKLADCKEELEKLSRSGEICWKDTASLLAGPYLRTIPGMHPCDGFFAAIIERRTKTRKKEKIQ